MDGHSYVADAMTLTSAMGNPELKESWDRIIVPPDIKERLVNHALLSISLRSAHAAGVGVPLHGLALLCGPPGVGKSSLARGVGSEIARQLDGRLGPVRVADVNLHILPSEFLGRTQRNIVQLFEEELPALAEEGPVVVVLDEVETLAVSRVQASSEINPADVFRGTAALLSSLDWLARMVPTAFIVATTNVVGALDDAVLSRMDLRLDLPLPTEAAVYEILADTVRELGLRFPALGDLAFASELVEVAKCLQGRDGRQVRKFVIDVLATRRETALDPSRLSIEHLVAAAKAWSSGVRDSRPDDRRDRA